jgi:hypothetical protein
MPPRRRSSLGTKVPRPARGLPQHQERGQSPRARSSPAWVTRGNSVGTLLRSPARSDTEASCHWPQGTHRPHQQRRRSISARTADPRRQSDRRDQLPQGRSAAILVKAIAGTEVSQCCGGCGRAQDSAGAVGNNDMASVMDRLFCPTSSWKRLYAKSQIVWRPLCKRQRGARKVPRMGENFLVSQYV